MGAVGAAARQREPCLGDQAYRGQRAVIRRKAPRGRAREEPNQIEGTGQEPALAKAGVEHPIGVIKRIFGFTKVRRRGLRKNAHRLVVTCALANLFMVRRQLSRLQTA